MTALDRGRSPAPVEPPRESGWLGRSRERLPELREHPFARGVPLLLQPALWAVLSLAVCLWLVFWVFW